MGVWVFNYEIDYVMVKVDGIVSELVEVVVLYFFFIFIRDILRELSWSYVVFDKGWEKK